MLVDVISSSTGQESSPHIHPLWMEIIVFAMISFFESIPLIAFSGLGFDFSWWMKNEWIQASHGHEFGFCHGLWPVFSWLFDQLTSWPWVYACKVAWMFRSRGHGPVRVSITHWNLYLHPYWRCFLADSHLPQFRQLLGVWYKQTRGWNWFIWLLMPTINISPTTEDITLF